MFTSTNKKVEATLGVASTTSSPQKAMEVHVIGSKGIGKTTVIQWLNGYDLIAKKEDTGEWKHEPLDEKSRFSELKEEIPKIKYQEEHVTSCVEKWPRNVCLLMVLSYYELNVIDKQYNNLEIIAMLKGLQKKGVFNTTMENNTLFIVPHQEQFSLTFEFDRFLEKKINNLNNIVEESGEISLLISLLIEMKISFKKNKLFMLSSPEICHKGSPEKLALINQFFSHKLLELYKSEIVPKSTLPVEHKSASLVLDRQNSGKVLVVGMDDVTSLSYVNDTIKYFTRSSTHYQFGRRFLFSKLPVHLRLPHRGRVLLLLDEKDLHPDEKNPSSIKHIIRQFTAQFSIKISESAFLIVYRGPIKHGFQIKAAIDELIHDVASIISFSSKNIINLNFDDQGTSRALIFERLMECKSVATPCQYQVNPTSINALVEQATHEKTLTGGLCGITLLLFIQLDANTMLILFALFIVSALTFNKILKPGMMKISGGLHNLFSGTALRIDEVLGNLNAILRSADSNINSISNDFKKILGSFNLSIQVLTDRAAETLQLSGEQIKLITNNVNGIITLSGEQMSTLSTRLNKILVVTQEQITGIGNATSHSIHLTGRAIDRIGNATSHSMHLTGRAIDRIGVSSDRVLQLTGEQIRGIGGQTNQLVRLTAEQMVRLGGQVDRLLILSGQEMQTMRYELSRNLNRTVDDFSGLIRGATQEFHGLSGQIQGFIQSRDRGMIRIEDSTVNTITALQNSINSLSDEIKQQIGTTGSHVQGNLQALEFLLKDFNKSSQTLMADIGEAAKKGKFAPKAQFKICTIL